MKWVILALSLLTPSLCYAGSTQGRISYYSEGSHTASGERFNPEGHTCAHRSLPFGTMITVRYRGREVACRVSDRGPFIRGRILDVSRGVARQLGMLGAGVIMATITY